MLSVLNTTKRLVAYSLVVFVIGVGATLGVQAIRNHFVGTADPKELPENPFPAAEQSVVVLGDSFASGEGALAFWKDSKDCHRAWTSYAYGLATAYHDGLVYPACSGAVIDDLDHPSGGEPPQLDALRKTNKPHFVVAQIGGNDAKFGDVVAACLKANFHIGRPCAQQHFLEGIAPVGARLTKIYREIKDAAKGAPVFVLDYPNPFGPYYCPADEVLPTDWTFLRTTFIPTLDNTIKAAAAEAGVVYVPMLDAFAGFGVCELPVGEAAINTISYLSNLPRHDSFHPNAIGHLLMAIRIESVLRNNGIAPPVETPATAPVSGSASAPAANGSSTTSTSTVPQPSALAVRKDTSPCHAGTPSGTRYPTTATALQRIAVTGTLPRSRFCYRVDNSTWHTATTDANGNATIATSKTHPAASVEVVYRDPVHAWARLAYVRVR